MDLILPILVWVASWGLASHLGLQRDRPIAGFIYGFLFGPIGILITISSDARPRCPFCGERHLARAIICPHCKSSLKAPTKVQAPSELERIEHPDGTVEYRNAYFPRWEGPND
jgi:hypothetical protein